MLDPQHWQVSIGLAELRDSARNVETLPSSPLFHISAAMLRSRPLHHYYAARRGSSPNAHSRMWHDWYGKAVIAALGGVWLLMALLGFRFDGASVANVLRHERSTAPNFWQPELSSQEAGAHPTPPDHPGRRPPAGAQAAAAAAAGQYRTNVQKHPDPLGHPAEGKGSSVAAAGTASRAGGGSSSSSGPTPAPTQGPHLGNADRRVSGLAPRPDDSTLHGGWELGQDVYSRLLRHPNVTVLSRDAPRVLHFGQLLSVEEAEHLIALATGNFIRSEVVADDSTTVDSRTSFGSWLNGEKRDAKVLEIQHRIHDIVGIPEEFGESIYVLRYQKGQKYDAHDDHCWGHRETPLSSTCRTFLQRAGGPVCGRGAGGATCGDRMLTIVMYLRSPSKGGATAFPHANLPQEPTSAAHAEIRRQQLESAGGIQVPWYCQEGAGVLQVAPEAGDAAIFWDYIPAPGGPTLPAVPDATALHAGCPVLEGTKIIGTRWIRSAEFH